MFAAGDSEHSSFTVDSTLMGEVEVGRTPEPLFSSEEDDEGKDTTMYFCRGREPPTAPVFPDSSLTSGCKDVGVLGTVLVMGDPDWEELRLITCCVEEAPALVAITIYLVAGGDGWVGVPGRVDMSVRELGTLMMLGVREPLDAPSPL